MNERLKQLDFHATLFYMHIKVLLFYRFTPSLLATN